MRYFDLHCDTLSRCADENKSLYDNKFSVSIRRLAAFECAVQVFAAYINDSYTGRDAFERFTRQYEIFADADMNGVKGILSIENLKCLAGDIENIKHFEAAGVKIASLVWNGKNELASGVGGDDEGLTQFGRLAVKRLERAGIVVDVSHLNITGFYDLCDTATKPFIATHSNSYHICPHKRNLTDEQFRLIVQSGGIVGINLYPQFIGKRENAYEDILRHIEHFLQLGGENALALGTDFDGADMDDRFGSVSDMPKFYDYLCEKLTKKVADKVFFGNANKFFKIL